MKKIEFDVESQEIQDLLMNIVVTSKVAIVMGSTYKNDVAHMNNDIAFMAMLEAHKAAMEFIKTIFEKDNKVSFDDLIRDIKKE